MKAETVKSTTPFNPYPQGYEPFRAIPVADAYPLSKWPKLAVFENVHALVPNKLPEDSPTRQRYKFAPHKWLKIARRFVDSVRRDDLRLIIRCGLQDAKEWGGREAVETLKRINPDTLHLPNEINFRFRQKWITRTYWHSSTAPDNVRTEDLSMVRRVNIDNVLTGGYLWAVHHSEEDAFKKYAPMTDTYEGEGSDE